MPQIYETFAIKVPCLLFYAHFLVNSKRHRRATQTPKLVISVSQHILCTVLNRDQGRVASVDTGGHLERRRLLENSKVQLIGTEMTKPRNRAVHGIPVHIEG